MSMGFELQSSSYAQLGLELNRIIDHEANDNGELST